MSSTSTSSSTACAGCAETFEDDCVQWGSCLEWCRQHCSSWEEVSASCVTAAKFYACALLHSTLCTCVSTVRTSQTFFKALQQRVHKFLVNFYMTFVGNRWIKLGVYFKFTYYLTYAEPARKTGKCTLLPPLALHTHIHTV
jgi:hypothetical protein